MGRLNTQTNDVTKEAAVQLGQLSQLGQDTVNWSNNILTQQLVSFTENNNFANESTTSTRYVNLKNFTFNFNSNNPLCVVGFNLSLLGKGFIGIFNNGLLIQEIPFGNTAFTTMPFNQYINFPGNSQKISLQWKATTGTISKANSLATPGHNFLQVTSHNS
jgi:hypothetical protein